MSDFGSPPEAVRNLRVAEYRWTEAFRTFRPYTERLRRLADAADAQRKAFLYAEVWDVKWKPRENAKNLTLALEARPDRPSQPLGQV